MIHHRHSYHVHTEYNDNYSHRILINKRTCKDHLWNYFDAILNDILHFNITLETQYTVYTDKWVQNSFDQYTEPVVEIDSLQK